MPSVVKEETEQFNWLLACGRMIPGEICTYSVDEHVKLKQMVLHEYCRMCDIVVDEMEVLQTRQDDGKYPFWPFEPDERQKILYTYADGDKELWDDIKEANDQNRKECEEIAKAAKGHGGCKPFIDGIDTMSHTELRITCSRLGLSNKGRTVILRQRLQRSNDACCYKQGIPCHWNVCGSYSRSARTKTPEPVSPWDGSVRIDGSVAPIRAGEIYIPPLQKEMEAYCRSILEKVNSNTKLKT